MNILPSEIKLSIFRFLPLIKDKYKFKSLDKSNFKLLNSIFHLYVENLRTKNKEWLLIELLIKNDTLALYYIIGSLPLYLMKYLISFSIKNNKVHVIKLALYHPGLNYFMIDLDKDSILEKLHIAYKQKYLTYKPNPHV